MTVQPTKLELSGPNRLRIEWSDGQSRAYTPRELRDGCPCATCRQTRGEAPAADEVLLPVLAPSEAQPLTIEAMEPVGHYAYSITFSDGHSTGIYQFDLLRSLGEEEV